MSGGVRCNPKSRESPEPPPLPFPTLSWHPAGRFCKGWWRGGHNLSPFFNPSETAE